MSTNKRIVEINGIKMEIDLRDAKVVDNYKVGDGVKVLIKEYQSYVPYVGMIVGFDEFENLPTIVVAYLKVDYSEASVKFAYINSENKDTEICPINNWDIPYSKSTIIEKLDREISQKEESVREVKRKKEVFMSMFGKYFDERIK